MSLLYAGVQFVGAGPNPARMEKPVRITNMADHKVLVFAVSI